MTTVTLDRPRAEARRTVAAAFERTDEISQYHVGDDRAVGKTGMSLSSWGERVVVDLREIGQGQTELAVEGEREVRFNITSRPGGVALAFLDTLEDLRGRDPRDPTVAEESAKQVTDPGSLPSGIVAMGLFLAVYLLLTLAPVVALSFDLFVGSLFVPLFVLGASFAWIIVASFAWIIVAFVLATLVTWYYEGTYRQRLPI